MSQDVRTLSVVEVAQALGVGRNSVYEAIKEGRLPALRVGTKRPRLRVPRLAIERLLADPEQWRGADGDASLPRGGARHGP